MIHQIVISRSVELKVSFRLLELYRWPLHLRCCFENLSFKSDIHQKVKLLITSQQKRDTRAISFQHCLALDFIDLDVLKKFPNLIGLEFYQSNIPVIKNVFTTDMKMLQYLNLNANNIRKLEAHVFDELVELRRLSLLQNEITEIPHPVFAKNKKLEFIDLSSNQLQLLHPKIFDGLEKLDEINFHGNPRINKRFKNSTGSFNLEVLNAELKPIFDKYALKYGNLEKIKELESVSLFAP